LASAQPTPRPPAAMGSNQSSPVGKKDGKASEGAISAIYHVFASLRFGKGYEELARKLRKALRPYGIELHIVDAAGGSINGHVFPLMEKCHAFLAFGGMEYGEDTGNKASTHHEVLHWEGYCKDRPMIPLRMIPFSEDHRHTTARRVFNPDNSQLLWLKDTPLPSGLAAEIKRILVKTVGTSPPDLGIDRLLSAPAPGAGAAAEETLQVHQNPHNLPPRPSRELVGREEALASIRRGLGTRGSLQLMGISGIAGVGKSSSALEYAHQFSREEAHRLTCWIVAETEASTKASYLRVLREVLDVDLPANTDALSAQQVADQYLRPALLRCERQGVAWLLVFDNIPEAPTGPRTTSPISGNLDLLAPWFFSDLGGLTGSIIFTSRRRLVLGCTLCGGEVQTLQLQPLDEATARDMLLDGFAGGSARGDPSAVEAASGLARRVGGLPLALKFILTLCAEKNLSLDEVDRALESGREKGDGDQVHALLAETLDFAQHLDGGATARALDVMAHLDPDLMPVELLLRITRVTRDTLVRLVNLGLAEWATRQGSGQECLKMHRLVQGSARRGREVHPCIAVLRGWLLGMRSVEAKNRERRRLGLG